MVRARFRRKGAGRTALPNEVMRNREAAREGPRRSGVEGAPGRMDVSPFCGCRFFDPCCRGLRGPSRPLRLVVCVPIRPQSLEVLCLEKDFSHGWHGWHRWGRSPLTGSSPYARYLRMTTATAKVFKSGNSQALRLPKAFRLSSKTVKLVKTADGFAVKDESACARRARAFATLAGSCPRFPALPANPAANIPRDWE